MEKRLLKAGALILCIVLCLCSAVSVFADWVQLAPTDSKKGIVEVKIDTSKGEVPTGMRATAFRIIKVSVDDVNEGTGKEPFYQPADPVFTWAPGVARWVERVYPAYIDTKHHDAVTEAYSELETDSEEIVLFIDRLAAAIKQGEQGIVFKKNADGTFKESTDPLVASASIGAESGTASIRGLSKGSYIVLIENGNKIYKPSVANLTPVWREAQADGTKAGWYVDSPIQLQIKDAEIGVAKTVSDKEDGTFAPTISAGIGDRVYFDIVADVPVYLPNAVSKTFVIRDELSAGLTFDKSNEPAVYGVSGDKETKLTKDNEYTFTTAAGNDVLSGKFTVTFGNYDKISAYEKIRVTYSTLIDEKAKTGSDGNKNTVYIDYSNNPYSQDSKKTIASEATVYTYGLNLTKTNKTGDLLSGAVFTVERQVGSDWEKLYFIKDSSGTYQRVTSGGIDRVETDSGKNLGKMNLRGLDAGSYRLKEVQAPAGGYVVLRKYVTFVITDEKLANGENGIDGIPEDDKGANLAGAEASNGYVSLTVKNSKGFDLPITGGIGTILFTVGGILLVAGAFVLLLFANRQKTRRS
ncbi:MAG: isopeptide-forming domain-containing fimbrial protein [Clostridiales bacterium]|nr:isopeptide-forming domain-containing fimbrial protein [Clostridiales bacterium]